MTVALPSWINKGSNDIPEWLRPKVVGRRDPNGSFLIKTKAGRDDVQARVLVGHIVVDRIGVAYTRHPDEIRGLLAELDDADRGLAHLNVAARADRGAAVRDLADVADRSDDTDEIGERLAAATPPRFAATPTPPRARVARAAGGPPASIHPKGKPARGSMPSIEWVQLDRLKVDDSYQRSIDTGPSRALIARIGRDWDWRLCVPLMVSRRADGLYVIDGQHRLQGARLRDDIPQLPCCISVYDGPAGEAAMFIAANRERRPMNRLDDFHAAQAGGDRDAQAVAVLIEAAGFTVSRRTGSASWAPGEVAFTSAIGTVRRKHGDAVVREALQMMAEAFPDERLVAGSSIFTAICKVVVSPPADFDRARLFRALLKFDMRGWADFLAGAKGGDDRAAKLRDVLLMAYDEVAPANEAAV